MKDARIISPSDVRLYYFGSKDVLLSTDEKENRKKKLQIAQLMSSHKHTVSIFMKLPTGETVEMLSDKIDYSGDFVIIKGGFSIPVWAILDVYSKSPSEMPTI